jgi:hypothetical protein
MHPDLRFEVQINAGPGYSPEPWTTHFTPEKGKRVKVDLAKDVKFTKKADSFSQQKGNVDPVPANANLPPLQEGKGFKPPL